MFGEKKPKKVKKTLDKSKNDDSDSGSFVEEKTSKNTLGRGAVELK